MIMKPLINYNEKNIIRFTYLKTRKPCYKIVL